VCPVTGFMKIAETSKFVTTTSVYVRQDTMPGTLVTATNAKVDGMVMDVKNLAENAPTTIMTCAIGLTGHAPPALVDSADQDAIYHHQ
jgi:hypothetical protein